VASIAGATISRSGHASQPQHDTHQQRAKETHRASEHRPLGAVRTCAEQSANRAEREREHDLALAEHEHQHERTERPAEPFERHTTGDGQTAPVDLVDAPVGVEYPLVRADRV
jgi:hypothetical protein